MITAVPLHRLIQNELMRWNSSLDMLQRLQEQKRARQQRTLIDNIIPVVNIFDSATLQVSSTNITASEYFCVPHARVCSEHIFSTAWFICDRKHKRLDPEMVKKLVFLNKNV
ncbi:hypothetical protein PR048_013539 [Dryococelus australis]|uniref:HAT C-terminal dimerisation domain-containing protein n=1 Tax=Dryococelus australis TaxID=614101 RepID=A0ABQ9HSH0_9NEOP|nr:hypothetical protein PR048_013539 [Dryococelus australis]